MAVSWGLAMLAYAVLLLLAGAAGPSSAKESPPDREWLELFDGASVTGWRVEVETRVDGGRLHVGGERGTTIRTAMAFPRFVLQLRYAAVGTTHCEILLGESRVPLPPRNDPSEITLVYDRPAPVQGVGIGFCVPAGSRLELYQVRLKPLGLKPLAFEGIAADGDGAIRLRGWTAAATRETWADFLFQVEGFIEEKEWTGGVGLRGMPGAIGRGYRVQLRNQWQGADRGRPIDFGTGGIYGYAPARAVFASPSEWFALTVLAQGNRIFVWVNGRLAADYCDNRPGADEAHRGRVLRPGTIELVSLASHGEIVFRNPRVVGLTASSAEAP